ncbi:MAG: chemotaxis protein CheW [Xanthomonadales bacterium]|nr:chemotaxis protein CheW [Xanthomonadales bacterium]
MAEAAFDTLRDFEKRSLVHAVGLPEQAMAQGSWSGIAFKVVDINLVIEIADVVEILTIPSYTLVPGSKAWVLGVANIRGTLVPIVDMRQFLGGDRTSVTKYSRVLVVQQQGGVVGLLIDEVQGQRHFLEEEETDGSYFEEQDVGRYVTREYHKSEDFWGAFNVAKLVNNPEFMQAAA